jgi:hypothetical protein
MVLDFTEEVSGMSWIAYYVEESSRQREQEFARRFAHPRPQPPRAPRRQWLPRRSARGSLAGAGRRLAYRLHYRASH